MVQREKIERLDAEEVEWERGRTHEIERGWMGLEEEHCLDVLEAEREKDASSFREARAVEAARKEREVRQLRMRKVLIQAERERVIKVEEEEMEDERKDSVGGVVYACDDY
ncbi:unnamed protein product [Zymoseptoria tritici ST99CH_1A5]|uniref:Uncharacterized protein n=1 Tax=Zymoseptoria tritici ST99CH_1A5 TaxID=1276529 RepID=A0A1Y6LN14_ZYMTR|nr:unnamed protein product [Zymoseptoria tritici ST99CH_1A5]